MVEAAGVEPASAAANVVVLHAYYPLFNYAQRIETVDIITILNQPNPPIIGNTIRLSSPIHQYRKFFGRLAL